LPATLDQVGYSIPIQLSQSVDKDTLKMEWKSLSIVTYHVVAWSGVAVSQIEIISKNRDTIANPLLLRLDSLRKVAPTQYPWTHAAALSLYADLLFSGETRFAGYPGNCPKGIETKIVDSLILLRVLNSKDSVGKYAALWSTTWTPDQIKTTYRHWLGTGFIRQGQYDTLYPFDDRPPTLVRQLVFTSAKDSNAIQRGTNGVQVEGTFADDSGIVSQSVKILSKAGADVTMKFSIDASDFPTTPQKTWSLKGHLAIKADHAPTDLYTLEITFKDRKAQNFTAKLAFSVYPLGGVAIDSIAPGIVIANPPTRTDSVADTTQSFPVRIAFNDVNLKTVVVGGDTVLPVDGVVTKLVSLSEGKTTLVRIWANDSSGNEAKDSISLFRKVAVRPVVTWNHPVLGRDSVHDTVETYAFRWKVEGLDIDSIRIDTFAVLLDNQRIAEKTLPLKLGATTRIKIRVVDKLRHVTVDSMDVVRAASVPPSIVRVGIPKGVLVVPDTQSLQAVYWDVSDNNIQSLIVSGQPNATVGRCGSEVFLKAGDTTRVSVWAKDKLGSISTDTVKIYRPDPRSPYLSDIQKVQRGDSVVPLTDFVLPNIRFGRFEVTSDLYAKVTKTVRTTEAAGLPMTGVNIYDAMLFCNAMSKAAGLDTFYTYTARDAASGYLLNYAIMSDTVDPDAAIKVIRKGYRLPTATEWDAAATKWSSIHPWGVSEDSMVVAQYAVWKTTSTRLVGSLQPTGNGLFDLAGNVTEWIATDWGFADARTPWLVKGGTYSDTQVKPLTGNQVTSYGTTRSPSIGFRIVRVGDK
jgi:hypothetical protein